MKNTLNSKRLKIAKPEKAPKAVEPEEISEVPVEPKKSAQQKEIEKVRGSLDNLATDKQSTSGIFSRIYSIPSQDKMERSKTAIASGQVPSTVNVYGSHYPVVRMLDNGKTVLLHTSPYGTEGKTQELVDKIRTELPASFPDAKVVEIHHPDYRHSAKIMRMRDTSNVHSYLENASQNHPDENYRKHALESLEHLRSLKKAEYGKPIHAKRTEGEGWDYKQNLDKRMGRLHNYLSKIGLTADMSDDHGRSLGAGGPSSVGINLEGDPHDQQTLHEAAHAMLTPVGNTIQEYQQQIGKSGFQGKITQTQNRESLQASHGGGMPEAVAQQMEAGIARRAGIEPFRSPARGSKEDSSIELGRQHAKKTLDRYDQGLQTIDPFTGQNELGHSIDAVINSKTIGDNDLKNKIRQKFKEHKMGHQDLEQSLAASEKKYSSGSVIEEMFTVLAKGSLQRRNPFNPHDKKKQNITSKQRRWTHDEESDDRDTLPKMEGSARLRALNKLAAKTHVRKDPSSGERLFLMHRGMGAEEFSGANAGGVSQYEKGTRTSWTPDKKVADSFAGNSENLISAWIPESAIVHSINQFNAPTPESIDAANKFNDDATKLTNMVGKKNPIKIQKQKNRSMTERDENEWIVEHHQPFQHAHPKFLEAKESNESAARINNLSFMPMDAKAKIGKEARSKTNQLQDQDKEQAVDSLISAKGQMGSKDKKFPKLAASEKTDQDLTKFEIPKPIKAAVLTTALASAGHQMMDQKPQMELRQPAQEKVETRNPAYDEAYSEGMKTSYVHSFQKKPSKVVIKEIIKKHPDLSESHGYMLKLSPNSFKEVIQHNQPLVKEVGSRYYDHLHKVFGGDHEKIARAWDSNIKTSKQYVPESK